jgi:hypothetical protein
MLDILRHGNPSKGTEVVTCSLELTNTYAEAILITKISRKEASG